MNKKNPSIPRRNARDKNVKRKDSASNLDLEEIRGNEGFLLKILALGILVFLLFHKELAVSFSLGNTANSSEKAQLNMLSPTEQKEDALFLSTEQIFGNTQHQSTAKQYQAACKAYVDRFAKVAVREMELYGIPASITLAQGLLESNAGKSKLVTKNKNHFGLKCFSRSCKKGHCSNYNDDHHKDFFRIFETDWASYRAHSKFLTKKRYQHLLQLKSTDYKGWAYGLQKAGYATDKRYANKLIRLIKAFKLHKYDSM